MLMLVEITTDQAQLQKWIQHDFLINLNPDENFLQGLNYPKELKREYSPTKSFLCFQIVIAEIKVFFDLFFLFFILRRYTIFIWKFTIVG